MGLRSLFGWGKAKPAPRAEAEGNVYAGNLDDPDIAHFLKYGNGGSETNSGKPVNPNAALSIATAYRCASILTSAVKTVPIDIKRREGKHRIDASDHPVWRVLRRQPNEWQTPSEFRQYMQLCVLHHGNAYAQIVRGTKKKVVGLRPLRPDRMAEIIQGDDMRLTYRYAPRTGGETVFDQSDILHLRGLSRNGIVGRSILHHAREAMGISLGLEEHGAKLFKNGARIGGVLKHPKNISDEAHRRLKSDFESNFGGVSNAHKTILLEEGMDFAPAMMTSVDAQFLGSREFQQIEIAMFYGVPPYLLGLTQKTTSWGSGIEQQGIGFVTYSLQDWLTMWDDALTMSLLTNDGDENIYIRLNPAGLARGDLGTRYASYAVGRQWGWLSINDIRSKEDMDPVDGGDEYLQPLNMVPIGSQAARAASSGAQDAAQTARARALWALAGSPELVPGLPPPDQLRLLLEFAASQTPDQTPE